MGSPVKVLSGTDSKKAGYGAHVRPVERNNRKRSDPDPDPDPDLDPDPDRDPKVQGNDPPAHREAGH